MKTNKLLTPNNLYIVLILSIITLIGLFLRLVFLDKANGMWHDEIITYITASKDSLWDVIKSSMPRPLYFLLLHFWIEIFGNSELLMRFLSVITGALAIPIMYFAGLELEKTNSPNLISKLSSVGITAALLTAVNSFLIYYSQEIRQYALLTLFSALSLYVLLKLINSPSGKNLLLFIIINFIFVLSHYISTIFIFFQIIFLAVYFKINNKLQYNKKFNKFILIALACGLPFFIELIKIFMRVSLHNEKVFINTFDPYYFDYQTIFQILQNWFTPILTGIYNNMPYYFSEVLNNLRPGVYIFIILPLILCIICIFNALYNGKKEFKPIHIIFLTPFLFLLMDYILSLTKNYIIISRYTLLCVPFALLAVSYGAMKFRHKFIKSAIALLLVGISLLYILSSAKSAPKLDRPEGYRTIQRLLTDFEVNLNTDDIIILPFENVISLDHYDLKANIYGLRKEFLNKKNIYKLISGSKSENLDQVNSRQALRDYFRMKYYPESLKIYFMEKYYNKLEKGSYFILAHNLQLAFYPPEELKLITYNEKLYENTSLKFMLYSKLSSDLLNIARDHMKLVKVKKEFPWVITIFKKV